MSHTLLSLVALLGAATHALACMGEYTHSPQSLSRSCYAIQRNVAGALEMWRLDKNLAVDTERWHAVTPAEMRTLVEGGYLQAMIPDPGVTPDAHGNIVILPGGNTFCRVHGHSGGKGGTAREQLSSLGVGDSELLALTSDELPPVPPARLPPDALALGLFLWAYFELTRKAAGSYASRLTVIGGRCLTLGGVVLALVPALRTYFFLVPPTLAMLGAFTSLLAFARFGVWSWRHAELLLALPVSVKEVRK